MAKFKPKVVLDRYDSLKSDRGVWETHWQEIMDYTLPNKRDIIFKDVAGSKKNNHLFDNSAMRALELLASGLHSNLTNPHSQWFELFTGDDEIDNRDDVRLFLQMATRRLLKLLSNTNFNRAIHELYMDLGSIGTGVMSIEEDKQSILRFSVHSIANVVVAENHLEMIDEVYREFEWTPRKIVERFGMEAVPEKIVKAFKEGTMEKFKIVHGVYPASQGTEQFPQFPYVSQWVERDSKKELSVKGFLEFPFVVPRWAKISHEVYGRSPAMTALPESKVINQMEKTVLKGAQKTIDPPLMVPDDGVLTRPNTTPGGLNYLRAGADKITPILNDARIDFGFEITNRTRARIRESFFVDQLQLQELSGTMTATEVERRVQQQMQVLSPILARQQDELLTPTVDRVFSIALRREVIRRDEIPRILSGRNLKARYSSPIARAQRSSEGLNFLRTLEMLAPLVNSDPSVLDNFDLDVASQLVARMQGLDQRMMRDRETVAKIRQQRAEAQQAALDREQENQEVENVAKLTQAAS